MSLKVLVSDIDSKQGLAAARMLHQSGCTVDGLAIENSHARYSRHINSTPYKMERFLGGDEKEFFDFLAKSSYDSFLPITAEAVSRTASFGSEIKKYCGVPLPEKELIDLCFDKSRSADFAKTVGVISPKTWQFSSLENLSKNIEDIEFPVVIKGSHEMSSFGAHYASDQKSLREVLQVWKETYSLEPGEGFPCLQQKIEGFGCGFFALYDRGECTHYFMHRRIREVPASGGSSSCAESIHHLDLLEGGKAILDGLNWHGVAMVEFKRCKTTGKLYLIEINPKFWGSLDLSYYCGVNFAYNCALLAAGRPPLKRSRYDVGRRFQWILPDELKHLMTSPRSIMSVVFDFFNWRSGSNIWLSDPLPTVFYLLSVLRKLPRKILR